MYTTRRNLVLSLTRVTSPPSLTRDSRGPTGRSRTTSPCSPARCCARRSATRYTTPPPHAKRQEPGLEGLERHR